MIYRYETIVTVWHVQLKATMIDCYRPQRSCGQGNIFTPVCHSFCSQGGLPQRMLGYHPPGAETLQEQTPPPPEADHKPSPPTRHPPDQTPPWDRSTPQTRHPPRPDTPAPQPPDQTPWDRNTPPHPRSRLQHPVYERPVRILLECILVLHFVLSLPLILFALVNPSRFLYQIECHLNVLNMRKMKQFSSLLFVECTSKRT